MNSTSKIKFFSKTFIKIPKQIFFWKLKRIYKIRL